MLAKVLGRRRHVAVVGVTAIVVISSLVLFLPSLASSSPPPPPSISTQVTTTVKQSSSNLQPQLAPWAFVGAYANYSGTDKLPDGTPYTLNDEWLVLKVRGTAAQVKTVMTLQTRSDPRPTIHSHINWFDAAPNSRPLAIITNDIILFNYNSTVTISGRTIPVTIYYGDHDGVSFTVIYNREVDFPIQYTFALDDNSGSITVMLVKTNIPGLMPWSSAAFSPS